ncbi:hypothetical protein LCGC14_1145420 [marine sediment metagenome]|uniref:Uncharacterized protein n=1 Tax=marine sediment metagenome TaxID=412755 RepID=A0A0F9M1V6_9ZZZZ
MAVDEKGNIYISEAQSKHRMAWDVKQKAKVELREANKKARGERTDEQQLARLNTMFGEGLGATRERERLIKRIAGQKEKAKAKKEKA